MVDWLNVKQGTSVSPVQAVLLEADAVQFSMLYQCASGALIGADGVQCLVWHSTLVSC